MCCVVIWLLPVTSLCVQLLLMCKCQLFVWFSIFPDVVGLESHMYLGTIEVLSFQLACNSLSYSFVIQATTWIPYLIADVIVVLLVFLRPWLFCWLLLIVFIFDYGYFGCFDVFIMLMFQCFLGRLSYGYFGCFDVFHYVDVGFPMTFVFGCFAVETSCLFLCFVCYVFTLMFSGCIYLVVFCLLASMYL